DSGNNGFNVIWASFPGEKAVLTRSSRVRRRVHDRRAAQHRRSPQSRETEASIGGRNPAEQVPIPIHPLGAPWPPRSIQDKLLIAISESRKPRRNSARSSGETRVYQIAHFTPLSEARQVA